LGGLRDAIWERRYVLGYLMVALVIRLLYVTYGFTETHDWINYRLPIAEQLSQGQVLYRDVPYDHMPLYPYYTSVAYSIFGDSYIALMSLAILGDALIAPFLYHRTKSHWIAALYAVSVVSIQLTGEARWDALALLFLLAAISYEDDIKFSFLTAIGICLKQFPAIALVRLLLIFRGGKELRKLLYTAVLSTIILSAFLISSPQEFWEGITGHSVYRGDVQEGSVTGSMAAIMPYWLWAPVFIAMLAITLYTFREGNYRNTVGILVFLATFMLYITHKHTEVAFIPFTLLLLQRSRYWIFAYLFCQYFIQLRMDHNELANYLVPLTFIIWTALVWENVQIAKEAEEGPSDIMLPIDPSAS
jgi:hypothetical protein